MAMILKCKMCGGDIEVNNDMTVGTCLYCGSTMTLPRIDSDKKARLFNRANDYRLNCEFDKAYDAYKAIVEEDEQEAEAYWGMILSEYGIEYVEDPATRKRIPTCHRTLLHNIRSTVNYKKAIEYADAERRFMYQDEAEVLDKLQREILSVSSKEEPVDVFICYKESNDEGERTKDSVIAYELFEALEKEGIRVFFSRVSLEEHLGENYEPYIYSALSSARVMLLVTTSGEHCESVWVKNEWCRFIKMMEDVPEKTIIPVYKGITAYDLPSELSRFQAQDYGKVGALQDLIHGVQKLLGITRSDKQRADINELIADKREREALSEKKKKTVSRILMVLGVACFIVIAYMSITHWIPEIIYREKITTDQTRLPDPKEYNTIEVKLTKENFNRYLEWVLVDEDKRYYVLQSKLYDDGWYYFSMVGSYVFSSNEQGISGRSLFPTCIRSNDTPHVEQLNATVKFVHKNIVKEYSRQGAYRKITLKNGNSNDNSSSGDDEIYGLLGNYPY